MENSSGKFITFEGADGVGKSTQVAFVADLLGELGFDVLLVREPGGTKNGEKVRELLLDVDNKEMTDESELMLYLAARSQIVNEVIIPALDKEKIVLCDRFFDSTLAYQGYGRGLDKEFIKEANKFVCNGLLPDLTILFYIPAEMRKARLDKREAADRIESAGREFGERVADGFLKIADEDCNKKRIVKVNTSGKHSQSALLTLKALREIIDFDVDSQVVKCALDKLDEAHKH